MLMVYFGIQHAQSSLRETSSIVALRFDEFLKLRDVWSKKTALAVIGNHFNTLTTDRLLFEFNSTKAEDAVTRQRMTMFNIFNHRN